MDYTRQGPFDNDAPPGLTGARLNAFEDGIEEGITKAEDAQGDLAGLIASLTPEAWRKIGAAGQPAFESSWRHQRDAINGNVEYAAFYKDPFGIVRLKGQAGWGSASNSTAYAVVFTLPVGYRPNRNMWFPVSMDPGTGVGPIRGNVLIYGAATGNPQAGAILMQAVFGGAGSGWMDLSSISFRVGDGTGN
jgi:hypothetical protein